MYHAIIFRHEQHKKQPRIVLKARPPIIAARNSGVKVLAKTTFVVVAGASVRRYVYGHGSNR